MAKVVRFHEIGGPEVLKIEDVAVPPPGTGEVQISIKVLGLNRAEVMFRTGQYISEPRFPGRPGYEAAGTVTAIGPDAQGFQVGDAVSVIPGFDLNDYGFYGDLANAPAALVVHHPSSLTWIEAAAVWMQDMTAYGALIDIARLTNQDTVLISAASSSVGLAAIQMANTVGATPVALTRTSTKRKALLEAGAAYVIATEEQDLVQEVKQFTGGNGARVVFDPVGGPTVEKLTKAMTGFGILFIYGALSPQPMPLRALDVLTKDWTIRGYKLAEVTTDSVRRERGKQFINEGLAQGSLKPIIDRTFPLDQIVEAHR